jgi:hypothetical protein
MVCLLLRSSNDDAFTQAQIVPYAPQEDMINQSIYAL